MRWTFQGRGRHRTVQITMGVQEAEELALTVVDLLSSVYPNDQALSEWRALFDEAYDDMKREAGR